MRLFAGPGMTRAGVGAVTTRSRSSIAVISGPLRWTRGPGPQKRWPVGLRRGRRRRAVEGVVRGLREVVIPGAGAWLAQPQPRISASGGGIRPASHRGVRGRRTARPLVRHRVGAVARRGLHPGSRTPARHARSAGRWAPAPDVGLVVTDLLPMEQVRGAQLLVGSLEVPWLVLTSAPAGPAWGALYDRGATRCCPSDIGLDPTCQLITDLATGWLPDLSRRERKQLDQGLAHFSRGARRHEPRD